MTKKEKIAFDRGYICAVACIISAHDEPTIASEVLNCNRPNDWSVIADEDVKTLTDAGLIQT